MKPIQHVYDRNGMRRAFHGQILEAFSSHTGYSHKEMKDLLVWMFCPAQFDADGVMVDEFDKHTAKLTDRQYARFLIEVQAWGCTFLGMVFRDKADPPTATPRASTSKAKHE